MPSSIGKLTAALSSVANENTLALANLNLDFSLIKLEAPKEYQTLGVALSSKSRSNAENGPMHRTARKLGALFDGMTPQIPHLLKAYGCRVSEISEISKRDNTDRGIVSQLVGSEEETIWAAATSGMSALATHLLICILARMFNGPECVSILAELVAKRKQDVVAHETKESYATLAASWAEIGRKELEQWDAGARSWLRVADRCKRRDQTQLLLIIQNISLPVSSTNNIYNDVIRVWRTTMLTMENLICGNPQALSNDGAVLLGISAWHLYPDLLLKTPVRADVNFRDHLISQSGILTITEPGLEPSTEDCQIPIIPHAPVDLPKRKMTAQTSSSPGTSRPSSPTSATSDDSFEKESIFSKPLGGGTSSVGEDATVPALFEAADRFATIMVEDEVMRPLFERAIIVLSTEEFEQGLSERLEEYLRALQAEAKTALQRGAVSMLGVSYTANRVRRSFSPDENDDRFEGFSRLLRQAPETDAKIELFLKSFNTVVWDDDVIPTPTYSTSAIDTEAAAFLQSQEIKAQSLAPIESGEETQPYPDQAEEISERSRLQTATFKDETPRTTASYTSSKQAEDASFPGIPTDDNGNATSLTIERITLFLTTSRAFHVLQNSLKNFGMAETTVDGPLCQEDCDEITSQRSDVISELERKDNAEPVIDEPTMGGAIESKNSAALQSYSLVGFCAVLFRILWSSNLPPGITRIYWQCRCGQSSYDDYTSAQDTINAIQERLKRAGLGVVVTTKRRSTLSDWAIGVRNLIRELFRQRSGSGTAANSKIAIVKTLASKLSGASQQASTPESLDVTETKSAPDGTINADQDRGRSASALVEKIDSSARFLHLCFLEPGFGQRPQNLFMKHCKLKPLSEDGVDINCDQELFRKIRLLHKEACRNRVSGFVKLKGIYFVKFQLYRKSRVSILKENKVPDDFEEYEYTKIEGLDDGDPPLSPSLMVHFYYAPEDANDDTMCLDAFPKRKSGHLSLENGKFKIGWGVYLKEEPSEAFFLLMKLAISISMGVLFGVGWNVIHKNDQKSFPWSVVAWMSAAVVFGFDFMKELIKAQYEVPVNKAKG